ncbi:MAG: hypothetical protein Kow0068_15420 [Marinilabiliales bacterium]
MIRYSQDFKLKEGIYLNFAQLKHNKPLTPDRIITDLNPNDFDFYSELIKNKTIKFYDDNNNVQSVNTSEIWGYCRGRSVYVNYNGQFNKIPIFGNICHFIAEKTVYHERLMDPFYDPYYYPMNSTYKTTVLQQYLLDMETGKIMEYSWQNVETILMRDEELYNEFYKLPKRKKKKMMFLYGRRYNERNPLYLYK